MSEKSKELMEQLAQVVSSMPEGAAVDALSHATARAEGIAAGLALAEKLNKEESENG